MTLFSFHAPPLQSLAVPSVCLLICFLAYSSQYLFYYLEPGPLSRKEAIWFNLLVIGIWWSYQRACRVNPGRLPKSIAKSSGENQEFQIEDKEDRLHGTDRPATHGRGRWCKKCEAVKPPRAHHCRQCGRCIPKMDHHCPWTSNCVSHTTFPHFLRFVYYTYISLLALIYHLSKRLYAVYEARNLPAYLGPSILALVHLLMLTLLTVLLLFALSILLVTATRSLLTNTTMIESWEIERHEALVDKARYLGGYVQGPGGRRVRIQKQEFPYDIGIWNNLVQGMGGPNVLAWLMPFAGGPGNESGWGPWKENGFEDEGTQWPPVDPEKLPKSPPQIQMSQSDSAFIHGDGDQVQAFRKRQQDDYKRWETMRQNNSKIGSRLKSSSGATTSSQEVSSEEEDEEEDGEDGEYEEGMDGKAGWTNSDGDRLRDYGVDEEAEMTLEDNIPLGELLRRRRAIAQERD